MPVWQFREGNPGSLGFQGFVGACNPLEERHGRIGALYYLGILPNGLFQFLAAVLALCGDIGARSLQVDVFLCRLVEEK